MVGSLELGNMTTIDGNNSLMYTDTICRRARPTGLKNVHRLVSATKRKAGARARAADFRTIAVINAEILHAH